MLDFDLWNQLLHQYVDEQGRVDYRTWKIESFQDLKNWLLGISKSKIWHDGNADQKLAFWLNFYNAIAITQVLSVYPIDSIRPTLLGIPNWIAFFRFFTRSIYPIGDRFYSLNDIEHGILRREFAEPRIHFALVCASIGCPLLRSQAYCPESVQAQLEADAIRFINNPDKVRFDPSTQTLFCSKIFQWYRQDFLKVAVSIPEYIQPYLSTAVLLHAETPIRYLSYDWSLNQRTSS